LVMARGLREADFECGLRVGLKPRCGYYLLVWEGR
jgi:hypothetical protein